MTEKARNYNNSFSFLLGVLCFGVVYLHSGWAGGFDIYTVGLKYSGFHKAIGLFLMAIVPSFFIVWGYLSCKYFFSDTDALTFLKNKIIQFYPIYIFSVGINIISHFDFIFALPKWKLILSVFGLYYESGFRAGGHIYMVVLFVVVTVSIFKMLKLGRNSIFSFTIFCMFLNQFMPHDEAGICYIVYFGYYTAFLFGVSLKLLSIFDGIVLNKKLVEKFIIFVIFSIGFVTPVLNFFSIYIFEIDYNPNSPEQLCFCVVVIYFSNYLINRYPIIRKNNFFITNIIHKIGNNAYGHFILQSHIIRLFLYFNTFLLLPKLLLQGIIILCTSCIVVYWVLPLYQQLESRLMIQKDFDNR